MKYCICYGNSPSELEGDIQMQIEEGWIPIGGVATTVETDHRGNRDDRFYQAMVKYAPIQ